MNIRPLFDRIVVKRTEEAKKTQGGIIIPDTAKEKPAEGTVIAVGAGRMNDKGERIPMDIKVGDRVLFSKYGGNEVKMAGEEFLMMSQDDVYAVVDEA
ncbi:co-chaperone GroES [Desulfobotulus sp. H1]|uniref:Co-chaperonin GroES n=1 Tax=Desulfobotulus pelophilus TaxID=2823377 RepID=A0ABT3N5K6_9BACT|nr:co-chaperone GroES [Desulfobotulus pelophilus]MCW7752743.1 co-chaperone GroES [Desulfobotulus pelophilus]